MTTYTEREARLVPTLLNVLVAGMCDPPRLNRGRSYARQGAVMDVQVEPGVVTGFVQGSRSVPYEVVVHVTEATDFAVLTNLVPTARQVRFDCSCPDWDAPCKHAVAVMYDLADRVGRVPGWGPEGAPPAKPGGAVLSHGPARGGRDPGLLATWRGAPAAGSGPRATVGSRSRGDGGSTAVRPPAVVIDDETREALHAYLGEGPEFVRPQITTLGAPRGDGWDDVWAAMLESALDHLREHVSGR